MRFGAALVLAVALAGPVLVGTPTAAQDGGPTTTVPIPPPEAFVVVDAETGAVLLGQNEHVRRPPASTIKLLTSLIVRDELTESSPVPVSAAAAARPARKLNILEGQSWVAGDLLRALLLCSCNDVAWALAEAAGGTVGGFGTLAREAADELGLVDDPVLQDPAGLDDENSVGGGNRISAYDMAIVARAFLSDDLLAAIVVKPDHRWLGPDGIVHEVVNRNQLLGSYPGAIGVKTGYTRRAGSTLVAAARRDGRTIVAVILGSQNIWYHAPQLLDYGFRTPSAAAAPTLPSVPVDPSLTTTTAVPTTVGPTVPAAVPVGPPDTAAELAAGVPGRAGGGGGSSALALAAWIGAALLAVLVVLVALRRRHVVRRRAARRARHREAALEALASD